MLWSISNSAGLGRTHRAEIWYLDAQQAPMTTNYEGLALRGATRRATRQVKQLL